MDPADYYIAGEGMRALPDDERTDAFLFFNDAGLMQRTLALTTGGANLERSKGALLDSSAP